MGLSQFPTSAGFDLTKLTLQQTITSTTTSITYPAGVTQVYAIVAGGGGGGGALQTGFNAAFTGGGGAGGVIAGWCFPSTSATIGAGGAGMTSTSGSSTAPTIGGTTQFGPFIAGGGGTGGNLSFTGAGGAGVLGGAGGGAGAGSTITAGGNGSQSILGGTAATGGYAGGTGGVPVSAEFPRNPDPDPGGADRYHRHLYRHQNSWFFHQYADAVRHDPGHRSGC